MARWLELGKLRIEVVRKPVRNLYLSVHPPTGRVRLTAPKRARTESLRLFAIRKLGWIQSQQCRLRAQKRETTRDYVERESHYVWGRRYLLHITECVAAPGIMLTPRYLRMSVRPGTNRERRARLLEAWYRNQIRGALPTLLDKWSKILDVRPRQVFVQRMKTRWGGCNAVSGNLRLNTELAKKPPACLEYILVHELAHLIEAHHNERFETLMDHALPGWQTTRRNLNDLPLPGGRWKH
ncbi:MAG: M48 family metallopeptidase [Gammaproteobacteria bacterium]